MHATVLVSPAVLLGTTQCARALTPAQPQLWLPTFCWAQAAANYHYAGCTHPDKGLPCAEVELPAFRYATLQQRTCTIQDSCSNRPAVCALCPQTLLRHMKTVIPSPAIATRHRTACVLCYSCGTASHDSSDSAIHQTEQRMTAMSGLTHV